jgi:hypothetical protein
VSYQAIAAADNAVAEMQRLQDDVTRQRAASERKLAQALKENRETTQKALDEAQAKRDGRTAPRPAHEGREETFTFLDAEDDYDPPAAPTFQMPEIPPPPRPTPRRTSRPRIEDDEDDDYSNQSWMR